MKVILTGCTGFIGSEVLLQCRQNPAITSIVALTRGALPNAVVEDTKVRVIVMKDFRTYSSEALKEMEGADGCIWCLGTTAAIFEVEIEYPLAFARAFAPTLINRKKPFRYLHCSGVLAEKDQAKTLWFLQEGRRIKGRAENEMIAVAKDEANQGLWETYIVKPSMVLPKQRGIIGWLGGCVIGSVGVHELAATMIDIVHNGSQVQISDNAEILRRSRSL